MSADHFADRGLMAPSPAVRDRIGRIVAIATSPHFPVPDPTLTHEHGSISQDEILVPFAACGEPTTPHINEP